MATKKATKAARKATATARAKPAKQGVGTKVRSDKAKAQKATVKTQPQPKPKPKPKPQQADAGLVASQAEDNPVARSSIDIVHGGLAALRLRIETGLGAVSHRGSKGRYREVDAMLAELAADYERTLGKPGRV